MKARGYRGIGNVFLAFFRLALRTLTFLGFYINYNRKAKSFTFRRGSEVSQVLLVLTGECESGSRFGGCITHNQEYTIIPIV